MYWVSVVTEAGIFAILALGLDVIWGWGGDFDLAFYGYLALGSYLTFVLTIGRPTPPVEYILGWHLPVLAAIAVAMVVVVGLAAVIFVFQGRPTAASIIVLVIVLLVVLGLIELIGRPPGRPQIAEQP